MIEDSSIPESTNIRDGRCPQLRYVLITPARNEAVFIEQTLKSVVKQTVKPVKWVIVSDGSTDGTDDIVKKYVEQYNWIELVRMPERKERNFSGKVNAFNTGFARLKDLKFDIIGNLDADISFEKDYISFLLSKFAENPRLGIGGTPFLEGAHHYDYRFSNIEHVSGACQLFRRECFEEIGGYLPIKVGGEDLFAGLAARMRGWQTRTFTEKTSVHHRKMGTAKYNSLKGIFKDGNFDYSLGLHPLWELARFPYKMSKSPLVIGGCIHLSGYLWALVTQAERPVPKELVAFRRREQMRRLRAILTKFILLGRLSRS